MTLKAMTLKAMTLRAMSTPLPDGQCNLVSEIDLKIDQHANSPRLSVLKKFLGLPVNDYSMSDSHSESLRTQHINAQYTEA